MADSKGKSGAVVICRPLLSGTDISRGEIAAIFGVLSFASLLLNTAWLIVLAFPFSWLWNWAVVPLVRVSPTDYWRALGMLLLWKIVQFAGSGVKVTPKLRDSAQSPKDRSTP